MKKALYSFLMAAGICLALAACNNGDYNANPSTNANNSINPLDPLTTDQFTWTGANPMSASINGGGWTAKTATWYLDDSTGANTITGINGSQVIYLVLPSVYQVNLYTLAKQSNSYGRYGIYIDNDSAVIPAGHYYYSDSGNSGEIKIVENDSIRIVGLFYFQGVSSTGAVINITNGYFNVNKY